MKLKYCFGKYVCLSLLSLVLSSCGFQAFMSMDYGQDESLQENMEYSVSIADSKSVYMTGDVLKVQIDASEIVFLADEQASFDIYVGPFAVGQLKYVSGSGTQILNFEMSIDNDFTTRYPKVLESDQSFLSLTSAQGQSFIINASILSEHLKDVQINPNLLKTISSGGSNTCVITEDFKVKCWGGNSSGELGFGHSNNVELLMGDLNVGVPLGDTAEPVSVSVGSNHACVVFLDGKLKCWGHNNYGQLGLGDTNNRGDEESEMGNALPYVNLGSDAFVVSVSASVLRTCAFLKSNKVKCWGNNLDGQLGIESSVTSLGSSPSDMGQSLQAVQLAAADDIAMLESGDFHSCVSLVSGSVKCWGNNSNGQLGIEKSMDVNVSESVIEEVKLNASNAVVSMSLGQSFTSMILDNGSVHSWGQNNFGQLALGYDDSIGSQEGDMLTSQSLLDFFTDETVPTISAGQSHVCASAFNSYEISCWGLNNFGQLGLGHGQSVGVESSELGSSLSKVDLGSEKVLQVELGAFHSCALMESQRVKCWGIGFFGELGTDYGDMGFGLNQNDMGNNLPFVDLGENVKVKLY